jgi:hypothetical protein
LIDFTVDAMHLGYVFSCFLIPWRCGWIGQELMDRLKMPSDAELMKIAIADLQNSSLSAEDRERALQELLVLVEPIDNANG